MKEVEVKILDVDKEKVEKKLISLGAKKIFDDEMYALLFDNEKDIKHKIAVRLRKEGKKSFFCVKKPVAQDQAKVREEYEVEISDFEVMRSALETLGFFVWLTALKRRVSYELNGIHFEFDDYKDEYEFVPEYLEIEAIDIKKIYKYAEILGFKKEDCKNWTFLQVVEYYSK